MNKKNLLKFSLINLIIGLVIFAISYFMFHFVNDSGITFTWQPEAGKPFVTDMIGIFCILMIFACVIFLMIAQVCYPKEKKTEQTEQAAE